MSHIVTFKGAKFTDLQLLIRAFRRLGWTVVDNANIRTYEAEERKRVFPHVAVNPTGENIEHYDVGLQPDMKGEWTLNGDFGMSNIHDLLSGGQRKFEKLQVAYNFEFLEQYSREHCGQINDSETLADGTVVGEMEIEIEV
jgi:uncharacterized protein YuzB (UPF0349 family)